MASSDADGRFALSIETGGVPVHLHAEKEGGFDTGISSLDAAFILQHVVGARTLGRQQMLACDVTGDGSVTALDAARVLDLAVGQIDRFPSTGTCSSDWLFVVAADGDRRVLDCEHPLSVGAVDSLQVEATLRGDCTGNWAVGEAREGVDGGRSAPRVRIGRLRMRSGRAVLPIYVRSARPYNSIDLQIDYDPAQLEPRRARFLGRRSGGIEQVRFSPAGSMSLSLASPNPINRGRHQIVFVEFDVVAGSSTWTADGVSVGRIQIDERQPRISNLHR